MNRESSPSYVLVTDAPPLKEGGHGCSVLAWNWIQALGTDVKLVVTHRLLPNVELDTVSGGVPTPAMFYPDLARIRGVKRFGSFKYLMEVGIFWLYGGRIARAITASGAERIFGFFGANPYFLPMIKLIAWRTGLPLDVYLVDDLEESCRKNGQMALAHWTRWYEPRALRRANRVFVISPGYVEHLQAKYGIHAEWLPIAFPADDVNYSRYAPSDPDVRTVAYIGAVNPLYSGALREFLAAVAEWNRREIRFKINVILLTYTESAVLEKDLAGYGYWEARYRLETEERGEVLRRAWAVFLPYGFEEPIRTMVSTSFPGRLAECMTAGRPLLVYGPAYASLPRYFLENGLPLCAQSRSELETSLREIDRHDSPELIEKYQAVLTRYHSKEAIRARLQIRRCSADTPTHL
ncbi:MAG: glycosyltransferase [Verrucomicrobiota bacterium]|jgi:hypothetical protein